MTTLTFFSHIFFAALQGLLSFSITWYMYRKVVIMDQPNARSSHTITVPRAGGVAIVITFFVGMTAIYVIGDKTHIEHKYMLGFIISSLLIAAISLYDDVYNKSSQFKLFSQLIAVFFVLWSGIVLDKLAFPVIGYIDLGWAGWIACRCYRYCQPVFYDHKLLWRQSLCLYYLLYLISRFPGFLILNFSPAKIFMGDVGSTFISFTFATLAIIAARYDESHISFFVIPLLLFNVIYDVIFTLIRRKLNGERLTQAHRTHLYHLMNQIGFSHMEVPLTHYCMAFLQGLGALWMVQIAGSERLYVFVPFFYCK